MEPCASESDEGVEVALEFFVTSGEAAEVFESREAAFDAVSLFVEGLVVLPLQFAIGLRRDDRDRTHGCDMLDDGVGIVALVGQDILGLSPFQQGDGLCAVVGLPRSYEEVHRQSPLIGQQMDLGRQTSSGTPQSLVLAPFYGPSRPADEPVRSSNRSSGTGSSGPARVRGRSSPTPRLRTSG